MASHNPHLPEELILEILLKLPVKSLLRFKSVCKNWYVIIKSPSFTNNHLNNHNNIHGDLLVHHYVNDTRSLALDLFPNETLDFSYQESSMQWAARADAVLGPLNGVFCLFNGWDRVALWNPANRGFNLIPVSQPILERPCLGSFAHILGFGLDTMRNTFKVIWILWDCGDVETDEPVIVLVYNLGTDTWRKLDSDAFNLSLDIHKSLCNTYLDGFYYWRAEDGYYDDDEEDDDKKRSIILSFDMVDEVFREIEAPDMWGNLALYNDRLAMFVYSPSEVEKTIEIWVMEGVGFWTKQVTIGPILNVFRPLGCWKNGEVLLETNSRRLILCDPSGKKEIRGLGSFGSGYLIQIFVYKESLVSVKGRNVDREEDGSSKIAQIREFFASRLEM